MVIIEPGQEIPPGLRMQDRVLTFPEGASADPSRLIQEIKDWLSTFESSLVEPRELLERGYAGAAVAAAYADLEAALRERLGPAERAPSLMRMVARAEERRLIDRDELNELVFGIRLRNQAVHTQETISTDDALLALRAIEKVLPRLARS